MFTFFQNKQASFQPGEHLRVDMHSHLIPGIDDGAPDMESSIRLIRGLVDMGYRKIITTPHIMQGIYSNTSAIIQEGLSRLEEELTRHADLSVELQAAAEYYLDVHFENLLAAGDILSFGAEKYVLVEMSFVAPTLTYEQAFFVLLNKGYTPVLAHPERYGYWHNHPEVFERLVQMGCKLQVNLLSLSGYYGKDVQKAGEALVLADQVHFLGTDTHHQRHLNSLTHFRPAHRKLNLQNRHFLNLTL